MQGRGGGMLGCPLDGVYIHQVPFKKLSLKEIVSMKVFFSEVILFDTVYRLFRGQLGSSKTSYTD